MHEKRAVELLIRYIIVLVLGLNLSLIYTIFTPLALYPSIFLLKLIYPEAIYHSSGILINTNLIVLIPACIAGAAYYLLFLLNFTTPMHLLVRIKSLLFLWTSFLFINILRIVLFSSLFIQGYKYASLVHQLAWYAGSTILVILIWFLNVSIFKINSTPIITDSAALSKDIKKQKALNLNSLF